MRIAEIVNMPTEWSVSTFRAVCLNAFPDAYDKLKARLPGIATHRIAMFGDTLHTNMSGGAAAGMCTILVTDYGLFRGQDMPRYSVQSGICPDEIIKTT